MKVTFRISESFSEMMSNLKSNDDWSLEQRENHFILKDHNFYSYAEVRVDREKSLMAIKTAMSSFTYIIQKDVDGCVVSYDGAYKGLLSQELLPEMTPVDLLEAKTFSKKYGENTMLKLAELRQDEEDNGWYTHPFVISIKLKPMGWFDVVV